MKRRFYETVLYDYTTKKEAEKHIEKMAAAGWLVKNGIYENGQDDLKYSVEYHKQH